MKLYLVGDSTVCNYDCDVSDLKARNGYGMRVKEYLNGVDVVNLALSGRSSRSFTTEPEYSVLKSELSSGDYLVIAFGHNDQKKDERFSDPTLPVSDPASFKRYLYEFYIKLAVSRGATPVICTPIGRLRDNSDYTGVGGHITVTDGVFAGGDYPKAIRELAKECGVALVDMTAATIEYYKNTPIKTLYNLFADDEKTPGGVDYTHLNGYGARFMAYTFCRLLAQTDCPLKDYIDDASLCPPHVELFR